MFDGEESTQAVAEDGSGVLGEASTAQDIPAEAVHGSMVDELKGYVEHVQSVMADKQSQIDTLSANLQSEMVARQALESRIAALESRMSAPAPSGGELAN